MIENRDPLVTVDSTSIRWPSTSSVLIPEQAAHLFRNDAAHPFRLIVARHSD